VKVYIVIFANLFFMSVGLCQTPIIKKDAPSGNLSNPATAIFITNTAGEQYNQYLSSIKDNLTSLLTQKGFAIVRTENALLPEGVKDSNESKQTNVYSEASLNRLAETLKARLMIVATVNSVTHEDRVFDGENTAMKTTYKAALDSVRINLQVYDLGTTKSLYGDTVTFSARNPVYGANETNNILISLFHDSANKISENVTTKVGTLNASSTDIKKTTISITTNVNNVDVFIDGMVVGSTGEKTKFEVSPGIHQLKLGKEMLKSWEKTVNIVDGANFTAQMELSADGLKRYKDIEKFNFEMKAANTALELGKKQAETNIEIQKNTSDASIAIAKDKQKLEGKVVDATIDLAKGDQKIKAKESDANIDLAKGQQKLEGKALNATINLAEGDQKIKAKVSDTDSKVKLEQSEADAQSKKDIAKGEREKRENSYIHDDGLVNNLNKIDK
jgi:hypothetical protein